MSFFRRLFGKQEAEAKKDASVSPLTAEQFFISEEGKRIIAKYRRQATALKPQKAGSPVPPDKSKFGGQPNLAHFEAYPCCNTCSAPLNFVLQLYKNDFPDFYFPGSSCLFQLFRCPNDDCADAFSDYSDHKMFHYYFEPGSPQYKAVQKPTSEASEDYEKEVPDCILVPVTFDDFPQAEDLAEADTETIHNKYGEELWEEFSERYHASPNTKFGGYPAYTQSPCYPGCSCGRTKEFFFQLGSEDPEEGALQPPAPDQWAAHGIMIGDVGNIYYYVCRHCGPQTIETNWDTH